MNNNQTKFLVIGIVTLLLSGCGGGGSGNAGSSSTTTSTNTTTTSQSFSLAKIHSTAPLGLVYSTQLTGSISTGESLTGSLSRTNKAQRILNGVLVTPSEGVGSISDGSATSNLSTTTYYDANNNNYISSITSDGITCTPASSEIPPLNVNVGDAGTFAITTCTDNTMYDVSWKVTDAGNGTIYYIETGEQKNLANVVLAQFKYTFNINIASDIVSYKSVTTTISSGNVITLQSL